MQGAHKVTDNHGEIKLYQKSRSVASDSSINIKSITNNTRYLETDSLIDPIWIAMLTLYAKNNRSMNCGELARRFEGDLPSSALERYFRFMHENNLVSTRAAEGQGREAELTLTPRAVRLVEAGLREHH